jgi:hypothetical protein
MIKFSNIYNLEYKKRSLKKYITLQEDPCVCFQADRDSEHLIHNVVKICTLPLVTTLLKQFLTGYLLAVLVDEYMIPDDCL